MWVKFQLWPPQKLLHMIILTELRNGELILGTVAISTQTTHKIALFGNKVADIITVSLHSLNGRQIAPNLCNVPPMSFKILKEFSHWLHEPIMHCSLPRIHCSHSLLTVYMENNQSHKKWHQIIEDHVWATRLGLCNSLDSPPLSPSHSTSAAK